MTTTLEEMVQLGLHLGHPTRKWNPKMAPYIYGKRNGTHIIDIVQTVSQLKEASKFVKKAASEGKTFLFVGTKKQISSIVQEAALQCDSFYVTHRWVGGLLTNWQTITKTLRLRAFALGTTTNAAESVEQTARSKKEAGRVRKRVDQMKKLYGGIAKMTKIPDVVIIVGQPDEHNAVLECKKLGITTITLVDTDCDPTLSDFSVPANDDSPGAVQFVLQTLVDAVLDGRPLVKESPAAKGQKAAPVAKAQKAPAAKVQKAAPVASLEAPKAPKAAQRPKEE